MRFARAYPEKLRNAAHFQLNTEIRDLITREGADKLRIKEQFEKLFLPAFNREDEALKKITKSAHTENLQKADAARDEVFTGMIETVGANSKHFDHKIKDAARKVKIITDTYGNVARKPLNEETAEIYNLLQDLRKIPDLLKLVKIEDWVNELERLNKEFDVIIKERFDESASKTSIVLRDARREVDAAVREIFKRIEACALVFDSADYVNFMKTMNVIIAKYGGKSVKIEGDYIGVGNSAAESDEIDEVESDEYDLSKIKDYDPEEHYTQLKVGDLRKHYDVVYKVIDLGQCHYPPYSKLGPLGWERMN